MYRGGCVALVIRVIESIFSTVGRVFIDSAYDTGRGIVVYSAKLGVIIGTSQQFGRSSIECQTQVATSKRVQLVARRRVTCLQHQRAEDRSWRGSYLCTYTGVVLMRGLGYLLCYLQYAIETAVRYLVTLP